MRNNRPLLSSRSQQLKNETSTTDGAIMFGQHNSKAKWFKPVHKLNYYFNSLTPLHCVSFLGLLVSWLPSNQDETAYNCRYLNFYHNQRNHSMNTNHSSLNSHTRKQSMVSPKFELQPKNYCLLNLHRCQRQESMTIFLKSPNQLLLRTNFQDPYQNGTCQAGQMRPTVHMTLPFKLTAHNWQKWKSTFLTCPCHKINRVRSSWSKKIQLYLKKLRV